MAARKRGRKRRRSRGRFGFLYMLLSVALILAAIVFACIVFFRVDQIEVSGQARYTQAQIVEASGVARGDSLVRLSKRALSKRILSRLPYVDEISFTRRMPDTLVIKLTECTPIAAVQAEGGWWILDARGKYLERVAATPALPEVLGITPTDPAVGTKCTVAAEQQLRRDSLLQLFAALKARDMAANAGGFDLTAENVILMQYAGRFTVKLPMSTDFNYQMKVVSSAVKTLPETDTGILDLTLEDAPHLIPYD
ncbi:MAG: FtsQ-type POTRA domain-containing protein [Pseudoflavonifractor sp.]